ncbi:MAG: hypothetical protein Q9181_004129 [Wetmoreana brouardii]
MESAFKKPEVPEEQSQAKDKASSKLATNAVFRPELRIKAPSSRPAINTPSISLVGNRPVDNSATVIAKLAVNENDRDLRILHYVHPGVAPLTGLTQSPSAVRAINLASLVDTQRLNGVVLDADIALLCHHGMTSFAPSKRD